MYINKKEFENKVKQYKNDILKNIQDLIRIDSTEDYATAKKGQPLGIGTKRAGEFMLSLAKKDNFKTKNHDGYVYEIIMGPETSEYSATINHLDIVPVDNEKWSFDAFDPVYKDGFIYGRGSQDDKGPTIAVYYAMKILKELGFKLKMEHKLIMGTNEENDLVGMEYFIKHNKLPIASFTADAEFPGVNSEKGDIRGLAQLPLEDSNIISFKGGNAVNIVISSFDAVVAFELESIKKSFQKYLKDNELNGYLLKDGINTKLHMDGKSAHGSTPEEGNNAATHMMNYLSKISQDKTIHYIANKFHNIFSQNAIDGSLNEVNDKVSVNVGILSTKARSVKLHIDIRYAKGSTGQQVKNTWNASLTKHFTQKIKTTWSTANEPLYFAPDSPIVKCLLGAFKDVTGRDDELVAMGGGTYAKDFPNCIAFGGAFKEEEFLMHAEDEKVDFSKLLDSIPIYAEAIMKLTNTKW